MDTPRGFSTNSLLNSLRSQFSLAKDNFTCEQIQDIMNIIGDLEHEITLLQTHYTLVTKQSHHIADIRENVSELLEKMSANNWKPLDTIQETDESIEAVSPEKTDKSLSVVTPADPEANTVNSEVVVAESDVNAVESDVNDDIEGMAKLIAKLVVEELKTLED